MSHQIPDKKKFAIVLVGTLLPSQSMRGASGASAAGGYQLKCCWIRIRSSVTLGQPFSNCGTRTTDGTIANAMWYN